MKALLWMVFFPIVPWRQIFHWIIWFGLFPTSTAVSFNGNAFLRGVCKVYRVFQTWSHVMPCFSLILRLLYGGLIIGWWLSRLLRDRGNNPNGLPLPPGPKGYPIIDNLFDMSTDKWWKVFDQWSKIYGTSCIEQRPTHFLHGIHRRYGILQDTRAAISRSRERRKDLWFIRETLVELLWSPAFSHA